MNKYFCSRVQINDFDGCKYYTYFVSQVMITYKA